MVDFEFAAEREDVERPESLDPGVGPDPILIQGGDETPGATPPDGAGADIASDAFGESVMPGGGFSYELGLFI